MKPSGLKDGNNLLVDKPLLIFSIGCHHEVDSDIIAMNGKEVNERMSNTEWQLSREIAEHYEECLVPVVFIPWAKELLALADLGPADRLLDLACGTGIVARMAADSGLSATGVDINAEMLAVAVRCAAGLKVDFHTADAGKLPFADESFDCVICQHGLQFFPDRPAALSECLRVLKPGGRAIFCTARGLVENPLMQIQVSAYTSFLGEDATAPIRAVCIFADPDETQALFEGAGFKPVEVERRVLNLEAKDATGFVEGLMKSTPVAKRIAALDQTGRETVRKSILEGFAEFYDGAGLSFPHSANVVVATRPV